MAANLGVVGIHSILAGLTLEEACHCAHLNKHWHSLTNRWKPCFALSHTWTLDEETKLESHDLIVHGSTAFMRSESDSNKVTIRFFKLPGGFQSNLVSGGFPLVFYLVVEVPKLDKSRIDPVHLLIWRWCSSRQEDKKSSFTNFRINFLHFKHQPQDPSLVYLVDKLFSLDERVTILRDNASHCIHYACRRALPLLGVAAKLHVKKVALLRCCPHCRTYTVSLFDLRKRMKRQRENVFPSQDPWFDTIDEGDEVLGIDINCRLVVVVTKREIRLHTHSGKQMSKQPIGETDVLGFSLGETLLLLTSPYRVKVWFDGSVLYK